MSCCSCVTLRRFAPLCLIAALAASTVSAQTPASCSVLSQMTVSSWLQLLDAVGSNTADTREFSRMYYLSGSYENLGCDVEVLRQSMDCVLDRAGTGAPRELARACLAEAGLTTSE
jgi:hypothetical protein